MIGSSAFVKIGLRLRLLECLIYDIIRVLLIAIIASADICYFIYLFLDNSNTGFVCLTHIKIIN